MAALQNLSFSCKKFSAGQTLVTQGSKPFCAFLILEGMALRYKYLANGKRQIFGFLLSGDLCDAHFVISNYSDHNVDVLADSDVVMIPMHELTAVTTKYPLIRTAMLNMMLVEDVTLREWLLNVGQRSAPQKLAHFICEISKRLREVGAVNSDGSYDVPMTQVDLADTMGLTVVHVSRCLQKFRADGLIHWSRQRLMILNYARLRQVAGFDQEYLPGLPATPLPADAHV